MEGKIFSFDLQRFENAWSLSGDKYVYGSASEGAITSPFASLSVSSSTWNLTTGNGASGTVSIDASNAGTGDVASLVSSINASGAPTKFDASSVTLPFYFKFASNTPITSITGGNGGASIDAALSTVKGLYLGGGSSQDSLVAGTNGATLDGKGGNDTLVGGNGTDTFYFTAGNTTIQKYTYGTDVVSLSSTSTGLTIPTGFDSVSTTGSDYVIALGNSNSLTFNGASQVVLSKGQDTYTYTRNSIAWENQTEHGISLGSSYTSKTFNGASEANSSFVSIDASKVNHAIRIIGNDNPNYIVASSLGGGTLLGGDKSDTLVAGSLGAYMDGGDGDVLYIGNTGTDLAVSLGADTFVYRANAASIQKYGEGDIVNFAGSSSDITISAASISAKSVGANEDHIDLKLDFTDGNTILFQSLDSAFIDDSGTGVSLQSGRSNLYVYKKDRVTWNNKSVTLTADYANTSYKAKDSLTTINAKLVSLTAGASFSITGNGENNYIYGSTVRANTIWGGAGNDTLVGNPTQGDLFRYTEGNDVIIGFNSDYRDKFSIDSGVRDSIAKAKAGRNYLNFTVGNNTVSFRSDDTTEVPTRISLDGADGGYLTKNGVVSKISSTGDNYSLRVFSNATGTIDLTDTLYSDTTITSLNAKAVQKQGLTIVAKSVASGSQAYYNFYKGNKKRDTFQYAGGAVSITGFESGKDRLYLANDKISSFSINGGTNGTGGTVLISLSGNTNNVISLSGAQGNEILVRQNGARGYSKMVFKESGVLENKAKNPTSVTLSANATKYGPVDSVKKITVTEGVTEAVSIYAGAKGSVIDASKAKAGVSLIGGAKNDNFTGSKYQDVFFFDTAKGGKDIFNGFVSGTIDTSDSISFGGADLRDAKISANKNAVRFKFGKNMLTVKGNSIKDAQLQIDGTDYTYGKNAIISADGKTVSLTSSFGGTYKMDGVSMVNGSKVTKNLMFKAASAGTNETLFGGTNKTTFKGRGGTDSLIGGAGDDVFFYAKGDTGTATIADFDFKNDKLKIAGGTLRKIESISSGGVSFNMSATNSKDAPEIGHFVINSSATYTKSGSTTTTNREILSANDFAKVLIHANNTYYWFAQTDFQETVTTASGSGNETVAITAGDLITWSDKTVSKSDIGDRAVIELNYGTNLVKSGVAVAVSKDKGTLPDKNNTND